METFRSDPLKTNYTQEDQDICLGLPVYNTTLSLSDRHRRPASEPGEWLRVGGTDGCARAAGEAGTERHQHHQCGADEEERCGAAY